MRPLKNFHEFLKTGIVRTIKPNRSRAKSLIEEAEKRKIFINQMLKKIGLSNENANYFIENSYDTLIELIRASMLNKGLKSSGEGAHEAEVLFMQNLGYSEKDIRFMNDLRYFRNGILYYGKQFDAEYAKKVLAFLKRVYPQLRNR